MEKKTMGTFLAALRKTSGMTQRELAERLGVSDKSVSRWECDDCAPDLSLIPVLAELFGVTCDELLRGERQPQTPEIPPSAEALAEKREKELQRFGTRLRRQKQRFGEKSAILLAISLGFSLIFLALFSIPYMTGLKAGEPLAELLFWILTVLKFLPLVYLANIFLELLFLRHTEIPREDILQREAHRAYQDDIMKRGGRYFSLLFAPFGVSLATFAVYIPQLEMKGFDYPILSVVLAVAFYFAGDLVYALGVKPSLVKKGIWSYPEGELQAEKKKLRSPALTAAVTAVVTAVLAGLLFGGMLRFFGFRGMWGPFAEWRYFHDPEEFVEYMETPVDFDENAPLYPRNIENENMEVLCTYLPKNNDVEQVAVTWYTDEFEVRVITKTEIRRAERLRLGVSYGLAAACIATMLGGAWVYGRLTKKIQ